MGFSQEQRRPQMRGPDAKAVRPAPGPARAAPSPPSVAAPVSPRHGFPAVSPRFGLGPGRSGPGAPAPAPANGLPEPLKTNMETMSGLALDDVRVHRNSARPEALGALAFTQGSEIHLAAGQEGHLPHEAWHVVQQKQGRVAATAQLKGVAINDDAALERDADRMGSRSAGAVLPADPQVRAAIGNLQGVAQRVIKPLTEPQMLERARASARQDAGGESASSPSLHATMGMSSSSSITASSPSLHAPMGISSSSSSSIAASGRDAADAPIDLDYFNYLQGLYVGDDGTLFVRIGKVTGPDPVLGAPTETVYARVDDLPVTDDNGNIEQDAVMAVSSAAAQAAPWIEPFVEGVKNFYTRDETAVSLKTILKRSNPELSAQIDAAGTEALPGVSQTAAMVFQSLGMKLLTGGEVDDQGGYGAIEFRFKKDTGRLYVRVGGRAEAAPVEEKAKAQGVETELVYSNNDFNNYKMLASRFPYPKERVTDDWIYAEEVDLVKAIIKLHMGGGGEQQGGQSGASSQATGIIPPGVPEVLGPTKKQEITFTHRPVRRGREAGQAAAMGKCSAGRYAAAFGFTTGDWEWLHLRASRLGGPSRPVNLVAGTAEANTHMIPYERAIYEMARSATSEKKLKVVWESELWKANGQPTHVAQTISLKVEWTFASIMDDDDLRLKAQAEAIDNARFSGTTGASFTKLDRDLVELNVARAGGT